DPSRVEKVLSFPRPTNKKQVSQFVGMCSYFSKNIKDYAKLAAPLNSLRRKRVTFNWTDECEQNFISLKNCLANPPLLSLASYTRPFKLCCDASSVALGSCLMQEDENGVLKPVSYYSKKFTEQEKHLSIYEKECLSVVYSIEKFHKFLEVMPFELVTDNQALSWILGHNQKLGKLGRWLHRILALPFFIKHVKSKENPVADAMSRMYTEDDPNKPDISFVEIEEDENEVRDICKTLKVSKEKQLVNKCEVVSLISDCPLVYTELKDHQMQDKEIQEIVESVKNKTAKENYYIRNGILMYKSNDQCKGRIYLPKALVPMLFHYNHNSLIAGHLGQRRTVAKVCEKFYRPSLVTEIKDLVRKCELCKLAKPPQKYYHGPLVSNHAQRIYERVYVDLMGPLTRSRQGYQYILIVMDDLSKFTFLIPLRNGTAASVIEKLQNVVFQNFSLPKTLICDNGGAFKSIELQNFLFRLGIECRKILPFSPKSNRAERMLRNLKQQLKIYFHDKQEDWSKDLWYLQMSLNSSKCESTGFAAHNLLFNYPFHCTLSNLWSLEDIMYKKISRKEMNDRIQIAINNQKMSVNKNRERAMYSNEYSNHPFKVGSIVYLKRNVISNKGKKIQAKMSLRYTGPFKILLITSVVNVTIQNCNDEKDVRQVHVSQ
ncbi:MAG: DDE-type integrase/transposase/recombinase, partial [Gammaproteobacteria bacterium]